MASKRGPKKDPPPQVVHNLLTVWDYERDQLLDQFPIDHVQHWAYWQTFLVQEKSFRYRCEVGSFTAVKEIRKGSKKKPRPEREVWYAHKRINTKLHRKYLGYADSLTTATLWQAAFNLSQLDQITPQPLDNSV